MLLVFGLAAIVVLLIEILLVVKVAAAIGFAATLLLLIAFSAGGAWIVKREGVGAVRRIRAGLRAGRVPTTEVLDGALIVVAGALLLPPGFLTGVIGLLLVIPPIRSVVRRMVGAGLQGLVSRRLRRAGVPFAPGGSGPSSSDSTTGPRSRPYRRPGEPSTGPSRPRSPHDGDVIDIDGEEVDLFGTRAELGRPSFGG